MNLIKSAFAVALSFGFASAVEYEVSGGWAAPAGAIGSQMDYTWFAPTLEFKVMQPVPVVTGNWIPNLRLGLTHFSGQVTDLDNSDGIYNSPGVAYPMFFDYQSADFEHLFMHTGLRWSTHFDDIEGDLGPKGLFNMFIGASFGYEYILGEINYAGPLYRGLAGSRWGYGIECGVGYASLTLNFTWNAWSEENPFDDSYAYPALKLGWSL
jgi:hypothetical protein